MKRPFYKFDDKTWLTEVRIQTPHGMIYPFHGEQQPCPQCGKPSTFRYVETEELHCENCPPKNRSEKL
jgi:hypothetical protein